MPKRRESSNLSSGTRPWQAGAIGLGPCPFVTGAFAWENFTPHLCTGAGFTSSMMKNFLRESPKFWGLIFLTSLSFFTRFFYLFYPSKVVFDEAYFGLYATKYLSHQYFFDIHPPLGKLLLASVALLGKVNPGFAFQENSSYPAFNFLVIRLLPAFFGALLVALIYLFVREMGFSRRVAFFSSFLALFDNALLVQSRFILLDIILVFFIFLALYLFLLIKKHPPFSSQWYLLNFLCGLVLGGAISIKWTGFGVLGIVWFLTIFNRRLFSRPKKEIIVKTILIFLLPLFFYFFIFALHFYLVPLPCQFDCGAVLSHPLVDPETNYFFNHPPAGNILNKLKEVHKVMLGDVLTASTFYYQSDWWSWPFMMRPVRYFQETQGEKISSIYFFGNPVVWWLSILGVLGYLYLITKNYFLKFKLKLPASFYSEGCFLLFLGYLIYMLSFFTIKRYMLMYHYLPALVFAIIIFAVFFEGVLRMIFPSSVAQEKISFQNRKANFVFYTVLILVFLSFLFFSPLSYGFPLTEKGLQARMWLDTWSF